MEGNTGILADTSVWIEFFRPVSETGSRLESLITANMVWSCGIVMFELLQGVRSSDEKKAVLNALSGLSYIEMNEKLWQSAAALSSTLKKTGLNLPSSDIFIAAIAIEYDLSIFTLDRHFEQIPGVKLYCM